MKRVLFLLLGAIFLHPITSACSMSGATSFVIGGSCYHVFSSCSPFTGAESTCNIPGVYLANFETLQEQQDVVAYLNANSLPNMVWIGAKLVGGAAYWYQGDTQLAAISTSRVSLNGGSVPFVLSGASTVTNYDPNNCFSFMCEDGNYQAVTTIVPTTTSTSTSAAATTTTAKTTTLMAATLTSTTMTTTMTIATTTVIVLLETGSTTTAPSPSSTTTTTTGLLTTTADAVTTATLATTVSMTTTFTSTPFPQTSSPPFEPSTTSEARPQQYSCFQFQTISPPSWNSVKISTLVGNLPLISCVRTCSDSSSCVGVRYLQSGGICESMAQSQDQTTQIDCTLTSVCFLKFLF